METCGERGGSQRAAASASDSLRGGLAAHAHRCNAQLPLMSIPRLPPLFLPLLLLPASGGTKEKGINLKTKIHSLCTDPEIICFHSLDLASQAKMKTHCFLVKKSKQEKVQEQPPFEREDFIMGQLM